MTEARVSMRLYQYRSGQQMVSTVAQCLEDIRDPHTTLEFLVVRAETEPPWLPAPAGAALNSFSSKDFKVFKGDIDVLFDGGDGSTPYRFPVEIQIHTLESFLRTVCGTHHANHLALKPRQFLKGRVPVLFPAAASGTDWLTRP